MISEPLPDLLARLERLEEEVRQLKAAFGYAAPYGTTGVVRVK